MPNEKLSIQDFAAQIKSKYPEYKDYDDTVLTEAILEKYPVYKGQVDYTPKKKEVTPSPSSDGESVSVAEVDETPNPFFEKIKELDASFGKGIANTPILAELVAGSNRIVSGMLDYANMSLDYATATMVPGDESFKKKLELVQSKSNDNVLDYLADTWANNADYIRETRNLSFGVSKEDSEKGIVGLLMDEDYEKAALLTLSGATEAVPSIALAASTGLGAVSVGAAGSKYREIEDNPAYSPMEKLLFANASGIVEGLSEKMGGTDLRSMQRILGNKQALDAYRNAFINTAKASDIYKQMAKAGLEEGFEESIVASFDESISSIKEGRPVNYNRIIDDFLVGMAAGGGTMITANGMNARGSLKREKARADRAQQIRELNEQKLKASQEQASIIDDLIRKNVSSLRTLVEKDAEFFSQFSPEDQKRIRAIDESLNKIGKQSELTTNSDQLFALQTEAAELVVEKDKIESKYRTDIENNISKYAKPEELNQIQNIELAIVEKQQRLDNTESESTKIVIQGQIDNLKADLSKIESDILSRVAPVESEKEKAPESDFVPEEEPTPVTIDLEVPKDAQPASFEDLISGRVTIKNPSGKTEMGRIIDEGNGKMAVRTDDGNIIELGNIEELKGVEASTLGLSKAEEIVSIDGNQISVRGKKYTNGYSDPLAAINRDKDGNILSVTLDAADGSKRNFRGTTGDEIAYNIILSQYSDVELEQELENLAQQDEETNTKLAPTPEAEVAPPTATAKDTEQAPEQEPVVAKDTEQAPEQETKPEPAPEPTPEPEKEKGKEPSVPKGNTEDEVKPAFTSYEEQLKYFRENPEFQSKLEGPVFPKSYGLYMDITLFRFPNGRYEVNNSYDVRRKGKSFGSSSMTGLDYNSFSLIGLPFEKALDAAFSNIDNALFRRSDKVYTEKEIANIISIIEAWQKQTIANSEFAKPSDSSTETGPVDDTEMITRFAGGDTMTSGNPNVQWENDEDFYSQVNRGTGMSDEFKKQVAIAAVINGAKRDQDIINGKTPTSNNELVNKPLDSIERFRTVGKQGKVEYFTGREMSPGSGWKAVYGMPLASKIVDIEDVLVKAGLKEQKDTETSVEAKPAKENKSPKPKTGSKAEKETDIPSDKDIIDARSATGIALKSDKDMKDFQSIRIFGIGLVLKTDSKKFIKAHIENTSSKYTLLIPGFSQNTIPEVKKSIIEFVKNYNSSINSMDEESRPSDLLIDSRKKAISIIRSFVREKADAISANKILFDSVTIDGVSKVLTFADAIKQMSDSDFAKLKNYKEKPVKKDQGKPTVIAGVELTAEEAKRAAGYAVPAEDLKNFYIDGQKRGEPFSVPNKEWWEVAKKIMNLGSGTSVRLDIYEGGYEKNSKRKRTKEAPKNMHISGRDENAAKSVKDVLNFKYKGLKGVEAVNKLEQDYFAFTNPWIKWLESKGNKRRFDVSTVGQVMWGNTGLYGFELISMARAFDALSKGKPAKKLVLDGYDADNFSDYASESLLPQSIKELKAEGFDVENQYIAAVAKAFNQTEEAVRKALGFEAVTDDSEIVAVKYPKTEELVDADVAPSGAYTDQKTQTVNSKEIGPIKFKSSMVSKNKTGELTIQQRIYEENDAFKLTGPETIQGPEDVAFLLRHLESAASENTFLVVANKEGEYRTIWLGTGTQTSQSIDFTEMAASIDAARYSLKGEEVFVYFIHNHPSGNLTSSPNDKSSYSKLYSYVDSLKGVTLMDGIVVNLDSGKFLTFNGRSDTGTPQVRKTDNVVPAPVYSFSRKEIYLPASERTKIRNTLDVANFLSKAKVKNSNKIGHLVLDQSNSVTYFAFVDPNISGAEWARTMAVDTGIYGRSVIVVGPASENKKVQTAVSALQRIMSNAPVLDQSSTSSDLRTDEVKVDYLILEEPTPEFSEEQGYTPLSEDELDHPSTLKSFLDLIKGYKWSQVQKEVIKYEEARGSKIAIRMKGLGKILNQLKRDLGGNFFTRKKQGITKEESIKGQMLAQRFMSESNKSAVVDDILKLKNGERILKNLRILREIFDDVSTALATESTFSKLPKQTRQNIIDNLGVYLNRSYKFFEDPTYRFKFGRAGKLLGLDKAPRNQAVEAEFMILHNNWIQKLMDEAGYTREQAVRSTLVKATKGKNNGFSKRDLLLKEAQDNIDNLIREYNVLLNDRKKMRAQGKGTNIPDSAFLQKKDIPVHIRELLGEVKDPIAVMAATGQTLFNIYEKGKMIEMLSKGIYENLKNVYAKEEYGKEFSKLDAKQQKEILDRVKKEPMIKMDKDITERDKSTFKKINDPMSPLNTKWVHKDIVEIIQASPIYDTDKEGLEGGFWRTYFFTLKNLRMVNVILNTPTWGKNAIGTLYFSAANGWFNPMDQAKNLKATVEGLLKGDTKYFETLEEMADNGVVGQSFDVNQVGLSAFAYYYGTSGDKSFYDKYVATAKNMSKKVLADLGTLYASIDDFGKMSIYQNERASFARKLYGAEYEDLSAPEQKKVRAAAAERVKDNTPTWGRITKAGRAFQRLPSGDFQGFRFEAFRSTYRIVRNTMDDLNTLMNDKSLNKDQKKEYRKDIARKMTGLGFVGTSAPYVVIKGMSYGNWILSSVLGLFGFDDDEEARKEKIKAYDSATEVRPGWLKNHKVWVKSIDDDLKVRVYDYTGFDPYAEVFGFDGYFSVLEDVVQPNMAVNIFTSIAKNQDVYGRDIADPSDPAFRRVMDLAKYGGSQFLPSLITSSVRDASKDQKEIDKVKRYLKLQGLNPDDFGIEDINVPKETLRLIKDRALVRDYEYDMLQQFNYAVRGYKKSFGENYLTSEYPDHRKAVLDDVMKMYRAVLTVAAYKGNYAKIDEATKIIERNFDDTEVDYMFNGSDYSDAIPEGYFD
jgi:hypothetical protein